jgi:basic membrane protein A
MKKTLLSLAAATALAGISAPASAEGMDKVKACFVYVGPIGDFGWSYQHDQGRLYVEKSSATRSKPPIWKACRKARMPSAPSNVSPVPAATSSSPPPLATWTRPTRSPRKFPDVKFEHATGYKREHPNVATYDSKFFQGRYVLGQIAGKMSKTGTAGYIASFPIPEVVQGINSFMLGAQSINPDFKLKVVWVNTWFDPGKEADAAKALLDQGATS